MAGGGLRKVCRLQRGAAQARCLHSAAEDLHPAPLPEFLISSGPWIKGLWRRIAKALEESQRVNKHNCVAQGAQGGVEHHKAFTAPSAWWPHEMAPVSYAGPSDLAAVKALQLALALLNPPRNRDVQAAPALLMRLHPHLLLRETPAQVWLLLLSQGTPGS